MLIQKMHDFIETGKFGIYIKKLERYFAPSHSLKKYYQGLMTDLIINEFWQYLGKINKIDFQFKYNVPYTKGRHKQNFIYKSSFCIFVTLYWIELFILIKQLGYSVFFFFFISLQLKLFCKRVVLWI